MSENSSKNRVLIDALEWICAVEFDGLTGVAAALDMQRRAKHALRLYERTSDETKARRMTRAEAKGAVVTVQIDELELAAEGREIITQVHVLGIKGVGPHPMSPISAAERLREALAA